MDSTRKDLYLVTGFLGSGKTTLMRRFLHHFQDRPIAIIINEFGREGVDGAILSEGGYEVTEIQNGSIFCVCRSDAFVDVLVRAAQSPAEVILVETSGLSDPTGMDRILSTVTEISGVLYDYCGAICVVDSERFLKLSGTVTAVTQQVLAAGLVLVNKTDISSEAAVLAVEEQIRVLNAEAALYRTSFCEIREEWLVELRERQPRVRGALSRNTLGVSSFLVAPTVPPTVADLEKWLRAIVDSVHRVKGFVETREGWRLVDCVGSLVNISAVVAKDKSFLVILTGGGRKTLRSVSELFREMVGEDLQVFSA